MKFLIIAFAAVGIVIISYKIIAAIVSLAEKLYLLWQLRHHEED